MLLAATKVFVYEPARSSSVPVDITRALVQNKFDKIVNFICVTLANVPKIDEAVSGDQGGEFESSGDYHAEQVWNFKRTETKTAKMQIC